jgi:hypothetical protein
LQVLQDAKLYGNIEKCIFAKDKVIYLDYVVSKDRVAVDVSKIESVQNWPLLVNISQVHSFLGLAGFYHHFVKILVLLLRLMNDLTKKGVPLSGAQRSKMHLIA